MYYSRIEKHDIANGDGIRVSIWVSGCDRHCKGCFNKCTWDFKAGNLINGNVMDDIIEYMIPSHIKGLTILGGEPLHPDNLFKVEEIIEYVRDYFGDSKDIWLYTGYTYEEVKDLSLLKYVDVLVDGPFIEEEKDISLRFRGSRNQRILYLKEEK